MKKKNTHRKTVAYRKNKVLWPLFSRFIRLRDCLLTTGTIERGKCISCGKIFPFKKLQAGHFIPGRRNSNLFSLEGTHAQCYRCNVMLYGNTLAYMDALKKIYGDDIIDKLREQDKKTVKFTLQDIEDMIKMFREAVKRLEALGGET